MIKITIQIDGMPVSYTHLDEIGYNKTDLFFLQQCAVWTVRENHGYRAYSSQSNYVAPVSYTHLDVYKRQGKGG